MAPYPGEEYVEALSGGKKRPFIFFDKSLDGRIDMLYNLLNHKKKRGFYTERKEGVEE